VLSVQLRKRRGAFLLDAGFELPTPGVVALFGRSGCGKSTLVNLIAGLLEPDSGCLRLDELTLLDTQRQVRIPAERRGIGCVFQDARLFPHLNVRANLDYARRRARREVRIDFDAVVSMLALGSLLGRRTQQLSGGERQRVAIGRALLSQPRLLALDEPLAALDAARREEVLPYLETLRDELAIPIVYVSHQFDEVLRLATHLVVMEAGKTVAQGPINELTLLPALRAIIGPDAVGSLVEATALEADAATGLQRIRIGTGELLVRGRPGRRGARLRVQILARDIIIATAEPTHLSVRNILKGRIVGLTPDGADAELVSIDIGDAVILARVTTAASRELELVPGRTAWALVKAVSLRAL
jgi:molybdate transport system ATP-binding protein